MRPPSGPFPPSQPGCSMDRARQAEGALSLHPQSYDLYDAHGKAGMLGEGWRRLEGPTVLRLLCRLHRSTTTPSTASTAPRATMSGSATLL